MLDTPTPAGYVVTLPLLFASVTVSSARCAACKSRRQRMHYVATQYTVLQRSNGSLTSDATRTCLPQL